MVASSTAGTALRDPRPARYRALHGRPDGAQGGALCCGAVRPKLVAIRLFATFGAVLLALGLARSFARHRTTMAGAATGVASASPPRVASAAPPAASSIASAQPSPAVIVSHEPSGDGIALDAAVRLHFDRAVDHAATEAALRIEPHGTTRARWPDETTLEVSPEPRWKQGRKYRAHFAGADATLDFEFRTRVPAPDTITPGDGALLVLSFDDAPRKLRQADTLLDVLARLHVKALLFPTGYWTKTRPDWLERAAKDGHRVCNHSATHPNLTLRRVTDDDVRREIEGGASDGVCKLFRPPLMAFDERVERIAKELGYSLFLWDIDTRDWQGLPAADLVNLVLGQARPGAVVLMHVHGEHTFEALPPLVEKLRKAGYVLSWDPADARTDAGSAEGGADRWAEALKRLHDDGEVPEGDGGSSL